MAISLSRRTALALAFASISVSVSGGAAAQAAADAGRLPDFPSRPITIVVPSPAGNVNDAVARLIGQELQAAWGQPVVVENRPGAGTITGTRYVAGAPKDGHTLLLTFTAHVQNPALFRNTGYDPVKDFAAVSEVALSSVILAASPEFEPRTVAEIVQWVKARPGELAYGSYGVGTTGHILGELFKREAGLQLTHVAYKGGAPLANDLVAGHVKFGWIAVGTAMPLIKAGRLRPVAFAGAQRSELLPEVPTLQELGLRGFEPDAWMGLLAPAGTPAPIVQKLNQAINQALKQPDVVERLRSEGGDVLGGSPEDFSRLLQAEIPRWGQIVKSSGASLD